MTYKEALVKAAAYCAYQERSPQQVRDKVADWELTAAETDQLLADLVGQKFLDEARFAKAYVRGKYSARRWGRRMLQQGLREHRVTDANIRLALAEIDPDAYWENLLALATKKARAVAGETSFLKRKMKVLAFLASKGYENDLARDAAETVLQTLGGGASEEETEPETDSESTFGAG